MTRVARLFFLLMFATTAACAQDVVSVGAGSYASFPPADEGPKPAEMATTKTIYVVSANNVPIPTNDWWTDLLFSKYCGTRWAHPVVVSSDEQGVNIFHPTKWNDDGTHMVDENPLQILGSVEPVADKSAVIIGDFDGPAYVQGWNVSGEAFGKGPARGTLPGQQLVTGFLGGGLVNSFLKGDTSKGALTSPQFRITRDYIHFLISGGNHPGTTCVNLLVDGAVARTATGENSEKLVWQRWKAANLKGKLAKIEIVDQESGGWGHINVDHIIQSDDGSDPGNRLGTEFAPVDARAVNWGDWTVTFRMHQRPEQYLDVTLGHGLPYVWMECNGVTPRIKTGEDAIYFGADGGPVAFPLKTDHFGVEDAGHFYGVLAPGGTQFEASGDTVDIL